MFSKYARAAALVLPLLIAACGGASSKSEPDDSAPSEALTVGEATHAKPATGALADMTIGSPDAPVTVIEYAALVCPHCARFASEYLPELKKDYVDTGKIKLIFREFPINPAWDSASSALARCAADKGGVEAFLAVEHVLFSTQPAWDPEYQVAPADALAHLKKVAAQAGIDEDGFNACLKREDVLNVIADNGREGAQKYGVRATPTFVINGETLPFRSMDELRKKLDAAYAAASGGAAPAGDGDSSQSQ